MQENVASTNIDNGGSLICVSGIVGFTSQSKLDHLYGQAKQCVDNLNQQLELAGTNLSSLVKLVVYYVQDNCDETELVTQLGAYLGPYVNTCITLVPLRMLTKRLFKTVDGNLFRINPLIEVEAYAITGQCQRSMVNVDSLSDLGTAFCHGLSCGDFNFVSGQSSANRQKKILFQDDLESQNQQTIENLQLVLQHLSLSSADIVKVNSWRAPTRNTGAYRRAAEARFQFLSDAEPAVTGITIPRLQSIGYGIRLDLWAMSPRLARVRLNPENHWGWTVKTSYSHGIQVGSWIFVGGQAALDRQCVVCTGEEVMPQLELTTRYIDNVLSHVEQNTELFVLNGWYCEDSTNDVGLTLSDRVLAHYAAFSPACTIVPVDSLAYQKQSVEFDAIARCTE